jgi:hypothetical protein
MGILNSFRIYSGIIGSSLVYITAGYRLDGRSSISSKVRRLSPQRPDRHLGPTHHPDQWVPEIIAAET